MVPYVFWPVFPDDLLVLALSSGFRAVFPDDLLVFAVSSVFRAVFPDRCELRPGNKKAPQKCGAVTKIQKH